MKTLCLPARRLVDAVRSCTTTCLALAALAPGAFAQTTWYVDVNAPGPGDGSPGNPYDSIQYAIEQGTTVDGDTLLVLPGTYEETVDYSGKTLAIRSSDGPDVTTILVPPGYPSRAVLVTSGEGPGTSLEGFEITGDGDVPGSDSGVGVKLVGAELSLRNCRIVDVGAPNALLGSPALYAENATLVATDCVVREHDDYNYRQGAIGLVDARATLTRCDVLDNRAFFGGGLYVEGGQVELRDCRVAGNGSQNDPGGGMYVHAGATVSLVSCTLEDNRTFEGYPGGAVFAVASTLLVEECLFAGNISSEGGALFLPSTTGTIRTSTFTANIARQDTGYGKGQGGAIVGSTNLSVERCVFVGNRAEGWFDPGWGGAILSAGAVERCTFLDNWARDDGGSVYSAGTVRNSILWGGSPNEIAGGATVTWSDVAGGHGGTGNIDSDPRFWDAAAGDLHLRWDSPCIDAGDPTTFDPDGSVADMGALPFDPLHGEPIGTTTCTSNPNSTGAAAVLDAFGSLAVADNDLFLRVTELPPNQVGYFLLSASSTFVPLFGGGQGDLCVGAPQIRFNKNVLGSGPAGIAWFQPDLANLPNGTTILPGEDWFFQLWYRDKNPQLTHNTSSANQLLFR